MTTEQKIDRIFKKYQELKTALQCEFRANNPVPASENEYLFKPELSEYDLKCIAFVQERLVRAGYETLEFEGGYKVKSPFGCIVTKWVPDQPGVIESRVLEEIKPVAVYIKPHLFASLRPGLSTIVIHRPSPGAIRDGKSGLNRKITGLVWVSELAFLNHNEEKWFETEAEAREYIESFGFFDTKNPDFDYYEIEHLRPLKEQLGKEWVAQYNDWRAYDVIGG